jgi:glycosyltransferase involved in cell wall biosynthesis
MPPKIPALPPSDPIQENERGGRVAILTVGFPPVGGGATLRMAKLAKFLAEQGWAVTVIRSDEDHPPITDTTLEEFPDSVTVRSISGPFRFIGRPAKRLAHTTTATNHAIRRSLAEAAKAVVRSVLIPDRYLGWAWKVSRLSREELGRPDVILSSGPPHSVHLASALIGKRLETPFVMDLRDDWARTYTGRTPAPWRRPIETRLERWAVRRAARVVHVSGASASLLAQRYPRLHDRFVGIPNGFDPDDLVGLPPRSARTAGPIRFLYAGSLQGTQTLGLFPEVFGRKARLDRPALRLRFVGPMEPVFASQLQRSVDHDHLEIAPPVSHGEALMEMASADVLLVFTGGGGAGANTITGKLFEYLALRRPILLVGPDGPAARLVRESGAGVSATGDDETALGEAIDRASRMASDETFTGASDSTLLRFDRRRLTRQWAGVLRAAAGHVEHDLIDIDPNGPLPEGL